MELEAKKKKQVTNHFMTTNLHPSYQHLDLPPR
jgi:hypothetical protein